MKSIEIESFYKRFDLVLVAGKKGVKNSIGVDEIHRPGLELTGFLEQAPVERIQIIGRQEMTYINSLENEVKKARIQAYVAQKPIMIIISRNLQVPDVLADEADKHQVPLFISEERTMDLVSKFQNYMQRSLAQEIGIHGVCMDIFGVGIIIRGGSGVGKSELALSLIERGHRLVSDDLVIIKKIGPRALIASGNKNNKDFLALRGIGLVNVNRLFGSGSIQDEARIKMDILIRPWEDNKYYDAVSNIKEHVNYLGINVEHTEIPIKPGRDLAALIEVAVKNWRLRKGSGYDAVSEFQDRIREE
jgi:HPr kinase/phosphorylase